MSMSGVQFDSCLQDEIDVFVKAGKVGEKCPWILFAIDKKDGGEKGNNIIKIKQKGELSQTYDDLVKLLLNTECGYALADFALTDEQQKMTGKPNQSYLVFISWTLESANIKKKMLNSASVAPLRSAVSNTCKVIAECHDFDDICPESIFSQVKKAYKL